MNMAQSVFQRFELNFWNLAIRLMNNRRVVRISILLLCINACLLAASLLWMAVGGLDKEFAQAIPGKGSGARPDNGQWNVLLVLVDDANAGKPKLEGLWFTAFMPHRQQVTFMPIYPAHRNESLQHNSTLNKDAAQGKDLADLFALDADGKFSPEFAKDLRFRNIWWDHYVVFDIAALAALIDLSGGFELGNDQANGEQLIARLSQSWDQPQDAIMGQAALFNGLCSQSQTVLENLQAHIVISLLDGHVNSDVSPQLIIQGIEKMRMNNGSSLFCDFPFVQQASVMSSE